jgi:hypothetical protein
MAAGFARAIFSSMENFPDYPEPEAALQPLWANSEVL